MTQDLHHLAAAYALDAIDHDERSDFEAHYPNCGICQQEVAEFREVAAQLASSTPANPPASLKANILSEIQQTRQLSPITPVTELRPLRWPQVVLATAAALVLFVGGAVSATRLGNKPDQTNELVSATDLTVTTLSPLGEDPLGNLQVLWSDDLKQAIVVGSDLQPIADDRAYALWFLLEDGVAPAGLFRPESNGSVGTILELDDLDTTGWGITIEPATGSPQPTTDVIYAGTL